MADSVNFDSDTDFAGEAFLRAEALACQRGGRLVLNLSFNLSAGHALRLAGANGSGSLRSCGNWRACCRWPRARWRILSRRRAICIISAMMTG